MAAYRKTLSLLVLTGCVLAVGCNDGRPTRVRIAGSVTIDGKPLTYGNVRFVPANDRPSSGRLNDEGRFMLTCYDGSDGAVVGHHKIQVASMQVVSGEKVVWHAPKGYSNYNSSGLTYEVTESVDDLVIELTSKPEDARIVRAQ